MHNSLFINKTCVTLSILDMFRALACPSSGGQIVLSQHLVSSLSIQYSTVCRMRAESALIRHTVQPFKGSDDTRCCDNTICPPENGHANARNMSRIESVTYVLLMNKELCIKVGKWNHSILWCTVRNTSNVLWVTELTWNSIWAVLLFMDYSMTSLNTFHTASNERINVEWWVTCGWKRRENNFSYFAASNLHLAGYRNGAVGIAIA
jgi:hypothetical protein